jgi:hypothetical protein
VKKIILIVGMVGALIGRGGVSLAVETKSVGAGQVGNTLFLGFDGSRLSYEETLNGNFLDKDTGWLYGGYVELRGDNEFMFTRATLDYTLTNSATYSGSLQNPDGTLTPLTMTTREQFYQWEVNFGYKALNFGTATLSPYAGVGHQDWRRGRDNLPDYREDYAWWFGAAGANLAYRHGKWLFALDGAVVYPFSLEMKTNFAGQVDNATFKIKPRLGFRVEAPISLEVHEGEETSVFVFATPYYHRWNIGASDFIVLSQGGVPVAAALEPDSSTDIYGLRIGVGFHF